MNELTILATLATVHFIALMSPGPDFALVVQNATRYGRQTGLYIALGLSFGILLHSLLSLTGVSYLVHQQPTLFAVLQLAGGSYLFYLGYGALKASWLTLRNNKQNDEPPAQTSLLLSNKRQAFSRGFATNILNPKALVFFVSLMSSLVPASMSLTGKGMALVILWGLSLLWFSFLAWALSTQRMQRKIHSLAVYIDSLCGVLFTLIGLSILWQSLSALLSSV
ncbi:LysE family translocator [Vibrio coralliilyticus]|uniref:LysE family translocator n=1 Tax=Vibrio coralliilyticus TaxID=190893 RepID=UPI000BAAFB01|nr:LysE family translocator [Vibrio coralliilyticus]NOI60111.1 LysE family translocator [Vibrio coralliilyticus]PAT65781.1 threonine transporter [Vibrio coralliilyticus]